VYWKFFFIIPDREQSYHPFKTRDEIQFKWKFINNPKHETSPGRDNFDINLKSTNTEGNPDNIYHANLYRLGFIEYNYKRSLSKNDEFCQILKYSFYRNSATAGNNPYGDLHNRCNFTGFRITDSCSLTKKIIIQKSELTNKLKMVMSGAITIEQNQENSLEIPPFVVKMNIRNDKNKRSSLKQPITSLNMKNGSVSDTYERNS
jgi:hypothetical protein